MSIVDFKDLNITAYFKQEKFSDIKKGAAVKILINSYPSKQFIGTVTSVGKSTAGVINLINSQENIEKSNLKPLIPVTITFSYSSEQLVPGLDAIVTVQR